MLVLVLALATMVVAEDEMRTCGADPTMAELRKDIDFLLRWQHEESNNPTLYGRGPKGDQGPTAPCPCNVDHLEARIEQLEHYVAIIADFENIHLVTVKDK